MSVQTLYKGLLQTNKSVFVEYAYAYSEKQAWVRMVKRIAKKQGIPFLIVASWFKDPKYYTIKPEIIFEEVEDEVA